MAGKGNLVRFTQREQKQPRLSLISKSIQTPPLGDKLDV
jgi:hypothetical protein